MEKEKNKGNPKRRKIISTVLTFMLLLFASLCGAFSYYIYPGHSLSDFSRFETPEEVVAFLHDNFDLQVTTLADIQTFMSAYPRGANSCYIPRPNDFGTGVDETGTKIVTCTVPTWFSIGENGYHVRFFITSDDLLEYIDAYRYCPCP